MNFFEALAKANQIIDAINMLAGLLKANTEATEKHTAVQQQLLAAHQEEKKNG